MRMIVSHRRFRWIALVPIAPLLVMGSLRRIDARGTCCVVPTDRVRHELLFQ